MQNYEKLNLEIIEKVIENHLIDFEDFTQQVNKFL